MQCAFVLLLLLAPAVFATTASLSGVQSWAIREPISIGYTPQTTGYDLDEIQLYSCDLFANPACVGHAIVSGAITTIDSTTPGTAVFDTGVTEPGNYFSIYFRGTTYFASRSFTVRNDITLTYTGSPFVLNAPLSLAVVTSPYHSALDQVYVYDVTKCAGGATVASVCSTYEYLSGSILHDSVATFSLTTTLYDRPGTFFPRYELSQPFGAVDNEMIKVGATFTSFLTLTWTYPRDVNGRTIVANVITTPYRPSGLVDHWVGLFLPNRTGCALVPANPATCYYQKFSVPSTSGATPGLTSIDMTFTTSVHYEGIAYLRYFLSNDRFFEQTLDITITPNTTADGDANGVLRAAGPDVITLVLVAMFAMLGWSAVMAL